MQAKQKPLQVATVLVRQVDRPKYSKTISSRFLEPTHASQMRATGTTCMNIAKDESGRPLTSEQIAFLKVWIFVFSYEVYCIILLCLLALESPRDA